MLRNPIVVGVLVVIAVVTLLYQVFGSRLSGVKKVVATQAAVPADIAAAAGGVAPARAQMAAKQPVKPVAAPKQKIPKPPPIRAATYTNLEEALMPRLVVEAAVVERKFESWVTSPLRDPFLLLPPVVANPGLLTDETNSPVKTWTLNAIWNQTGSRLAVINDRVCAVGDVLVEGYKLIRIERDEVWFQGPYQNERLGFAEPKSASATPARPLTKRPGRKM
ncbi:MAG TPA: hypothetical protein VJA21_18400 [Verrucomicrobiae bacterium]